MTASNEPNTGDRHVLVAVGDDGVATVTLNRPEQMNAWTREMSDQLSDAMEALDADDAVRVIVVTGAGRAFCAGVDIGRFTTRDPAKEPPRRPWRDRRVPSSISKPVVAAINGHAVGVGLSYVMHCDVRFVAEDAKLGFVFNRRGMAPEVGVHALLPRVVGHGNAAELLLSGRIFSGAEAVRLGLASAAIPAPEVLAHALDWATDVATHCNPASVGATKWLMWGPTADDDRHAVDIEDGLAVHFAGTPDSREGMLSFRERRPPTWSSTHAVGANVAAELARRTAGSAAPRGPERR
ncbi:MAG: enoyl-CoA hydratase/isomerase family protein [Desertimonas sp.]